MGGIDELWNERKEEQRDFGIEDVHDERFGKYLPFGTNRWLGGVDSAASAA